MSNVIPFRRKPVAAPHTFDDGGREAAGFKGTAGDCVVRAIAIASGLDYRTVYEELRGRNKRHPKGGSPRDRGTPRDVYHAYLLELGFEWTPTMKIGSGCRVHARPDELPGGTLVLRLSKHLCAMIDGVVHDTYDPTRDGTRCVYGYYQETRP